MKICYENWRPGPDARIDIRRAEAICAEYGEQGYDLTLRQLYYQFVARDWIPNTQQSYKRLGTIINNARMSGLLDWSYITDRTRHLRGNSHWGTPADVIRSAAYGYAIDKWQDQPRRVEVWVEKDALAGIVGRVAAERDVDFFACRGYVSQSELWAAGRRLGRYLMNRQAVTILHLGDHDPSGIDMTRDIRERLELFIATDWRDVHGFDDDTTTAEVFELIRKDFEYERGRDIGAPLEVRRIALNRHQVTRYNPPPNPAKLTDSRASGYIREHGTQSWELDALDPSTLAALIGDHIDSVLDTGLYRVREQVEGQHRELLNAASQRWTEVASMLGGAA